MSAYAYPISLALISLFTMGLEWLVPHRKEQKQFRPGLGWDVLHLIFNGHFLGVIFYGIATTWMLPAFDTWLASIGIVDAVYRSAASPWPLSVQIVVALSFTDFFQCSVHNLSHRVPLFSLSHRCHHPA